MPQPRIKLPKAKVADFCRQHHIRKLALYGSVLRDDFGPDNDVDVLDAGHEAIGFASGHTRRDLDENRIKP